jgi:hypothetical protein
LSTIVTGDDTWIHHFESETKRQSMEWHHTTFPRKKKFKAFLSASKIMATVFWDCEGVILIEVLHRGQRSTRTSMWTLWRSWRSVSGGFVPINMWQKCFFTTTVRGHTRLHTREAITKL